MILVDNIGSISGVRLQKRRDSSELSEQLQKVKEVLKSKKWNLLSCEESNINRSFEKDDFDRVLSTLHTNWTSLTTKFAVDVENWTAQRRIVLRRFKDFKKRLENTRIVSSLGRAVLSTVDALGTVVAIYLQSVQNGWSRSVLHASGAMGLSGLAVALVEDYVYKSSLSEMIEELRKDQELFIKIYKDFVKLVELDKQVQKLFPYGIDLGLLEVVRSDSIDDDSKEKKELFEAMKPIGLLDSNCVISFVVILSNARNDVSLLDDEKFIQSVKKFSTSRFAKEWWNRTLNLEKFPSSSVPETISKLMGLLKKNMSSLHHIQVPLITTPAMYYEGVPTILSIFLNSVMAVDALLEMNQKECKEGSTMSKIKRSLKKEYVEVRQLNEVLNPYYN